MSTDPYSLADLCHEAARQHRDLTQDPDYVCTGERMEDAHVPSAKTAEDGSALTWLELLGDEGDYTAAYEAAQRKIYDLINGAADVSAWAIDLGAEGLEPGPHITWRDDDGKAFTAVHIALGDQIADKAAVAEAIRAAVRSALGLKPA